MSQCFCEKVRILMRIPLLNENSKLAQLQAQESAWLKECANLIRLLESGDKQTTLDVLCVEPEMITNPKNVWESISNNYETLTEYVDKTLSREKKAQIWSKMWQTHLDDTLHETLLVCIDKIV
jgi:hypothetical protein